MWQPGQLGWWNPDWDGKAHRRRSISWTTWLEQAESVCGWAVEIATRWFFQEVYILYSDFSLSLFLFFCLSFFIYLFLSFCIFFYLFLSTVLSLSFFPPFFLFSFFIYLVFFLCVFLYLFGVSLFFSLCLVLFLCFFLPLLFIYLCCSSSFFLFLFPH